MFLRNCQKKLTKVNTLNRLACFFGPWLLPILFCVAVFSSCKKKQVTLEPFPIVTGVDSSNNEVAVLKPIALPLALDSILHPTYTMCEGKIKAVYQDENRRLPFTINFKTVRGVKSIFTVTASIGIPVATGWVRNDSVWIDSRFSNQKIKEPLTKLTDITGLPPDLSVVEGVLTGQFAIPKSFFPVEATDSTLLAYPLPDTEWRLLMTFTSKDTWPHKIELRDGAGTYTIVNTNYGPFPGPKNSMLVQSDSSGKVLTSLKLETLSRRFSK